MTEAERFRRTIVARLPPGIRVTFTNAPAPDHSELVGELRFLVSLDMRERGGPYQGFAAGRCMDAMRQAADALEGVRP